MSKHVAKAISSLTDVTEGLRTITLLIVAALDKQKHIDSNQFLYDISLLIEHSYPPDAEIPITVLDFRAELARRIAARE